MDDMDKKLLDGQQD
jgi:hypothetical protein